MTVGANPLASRATIAPAAPPPIPAVQFRAFVDAFERLGYDVESLLADIGLRRADLADPDRLVPCATCGRLFERACQTRSLRHLGPRLAAETPIGAFPLLDYLAVTSDDVGHACRQIARYFRLVAAPYVIEIDEADDPIRLRYVAPGPMSALGIEYGIALQVLHLREESEHRIQFEFASLEHQPEDVVEIERILRCPIRVNASWSGLEIPRQSWKLSMRRRDPVLRGVLEHHADEIVARLPSGDTFLQDVRRAVASRLTRGDAGIEAVARDLAVSARTLQRRLASAGVSYQDLADRTIRAMAEKQLAASALAISEIAYLVGYSEPAAFHRAFKRWTGVTPQAFRQAARAGHAQ